MKKTLLLLICMIAVALMQAQVPQAFSYKVQIKGNNGNPHANKKINLKISIIQDNIDGAIVYIEKHEINTSPSGIVDIEIGRGTPLLGLFRQIDWKQWPYFVKAEVDLKCGGKYNLIATTELLTVPYAMFAGSAANGFSGNYYDLQNQPNIPTKLSELNNDVNFINSEADPIFINSPANTILADDIVKWNKVYNWGNHAGLYKPLGYLPSWTELTENPFKITSPLADQLLKYNAVLGKWENWVPDFLKTESDGSVTNEIQTLSIDNDVISLTSGGSVKLPAITGQYYFFDKDKDGFGDGNHPVWVPTGVTAPANFIAGIIDCDDNNPAIHPEATEICGDGIDQDCDGSDLPCADPNLNWVAGNNWVDPVSGYSYKTVQIGSQVWMAENLRATKFNDGTNIPFAMDAGTWSNYNTTPGACWNSYNQNNGNTYGCLYNWYAVNTGILCPVGWHVPTRDEWWVTLISYLGGPFVALDKLRERDTWIITGQTNSSGFSALAGGIVNNYGIASDNHVAAYFYTAYELSAVYGAAVEIRPTNSGVELKGFNKKYGLSVRCVKD